MDYFLCSSIAYPSGEIVYNAFVRTPLPSLQMDK